MDIHDASTYQKPMVSLTGLFTNISQRGDKEIKLSNLQYPLPHFTTTVVYSSKFKDIKLIHASGISYRSFKCNKVKEVKILKASSIYFKPFHPIKSDKVKELEFHNVPQISFKPLHPFKNKKVKEVKLPQCLKYLFKELTST